MKRQKKFYKKLKYNDFEWTGFVGEYHCFSKYVPKKGYLETKCREKDIEDGNWKTMIDYGVTL